MNPSIEGYNSEGELRILNQLIKDKRLALYGVTAKVITIWRTLMDHINMIRKYIYLSNKTIGL